MRFYLHCQFIVVASLLGAFALMLLLEATDLIDVGRDMLLPALFVFGILVLPGFLLSYRLRLTWRGHIKVMAPWILLLYLFIAFALGIMTLDAIFLGWYGLAVAVVLLPWSLSAILGSHLRDN